MQGPSRGAALGGWMEGPPPLAACSWHQPQGLQVGAAGKEGTGARAWIHRACAQRSRKTHTRRYPCASVSLPLRGVLGRNASASGERGHRGDTETVLQAPQQDGSPSASSNPSEDPGLSPRPSHPTAPSRTLPPRPAPALAHREFPKQAPQNSPSPRSLPLPLPSSAPRDPSTPQQAPRASRELFCRSTVPAGHRARSRSRFLRADWSSRLGTGQGQDTCGLAIHISSLLLGRMGAGGSCLARADSAPTPPQILSGDELPLSGQPTSAAFAPGEMPTEEFALHAVTPALIIGIKLASLFHKSSRELISCSSFSARGS